MKKILLKSCAKALLLSISLTTSVCAFGAAITVTSNGVKYKSDKNKKYLMVVAAPYTGDIVVASSVYIESLEKELPVTQVGASAFSELTGLNSVTLPESVTTINDYAFDSAENLKTVKFGGKLKTIGNWVFRNCYALEKLEFPEGLTEIGNFTFDKNLKMTEVTLPASLTKIGGFIFEGNPQLKTVYCLATEPPAVKKGYMDGDEIYTIFDDNDYGDRVLYVPKGTIDTYKLTFGWNQFKEIREIEGSGVSAVETSQNVEVKACGNNAVEVNAAEAMCVIGYSVDGRLLFAKNVPAGQTIINDVPSGVMIVGGQKVLVK